MHKDEIEKKKLQKTLKAKQIVIKKIGIKINIKLEDTIDF